MPPQDPENPYLPPIVLTEHPPGDVYPAPNITLVSEGNENSNPWRSFDEVAAGIAYQDPRQAMLDELAGDVPISVEIRGAGVAG